MLTTIFSGEFIFLSVPFQVSYKKHGILTSLGYPPVLILAIRAFSGPGKLKMVWT